MLKEFLPLLPLVVQLLPLVGQQQEEVVEMKKAIQQIAENLQQQSSSCPSSYNSDMQNPKKAEVTFDAIYENYFQFDTLKEYFGDHTAEYYTLIRSIIVVTVVTVLFTNVFVVSIVTLLGMMPHRFSTKISVVTALNNLID